MGHFNKEFFAREYGKNLQILAAIAFSYGPTYHELINAQLRGSQHC